METMLCPRCQCDLKKEAFSNIHLATCSQCRGTWYYGETLAKLLSLQKNRELMNFSKDIFLQQESDLNCPECKCHMEAKTFKNDKGLTIDQCKHCQGVWLDKNEFPKTKQLIREQVAAKRKDAANQETIGKIHPFRLYPVPKTEKPMPVVIKKIQPITLDMEERDEVAEERELDEGTYAAEVTAGLWAFTALTGFPVEAYNPPRRRFPYVVVSFIVINFLIQWILSTFSMAHLSDFFRTYGAVPEKILGGMSLFTLVSYAFIHGGWLHLIGNMYFLWIFGDNVEDRLGHFGFILFYLACGILSALVQVIAMVKMGIPATPLVGASGAVAGVMGAYLYFFPKAALYQTIIIPYPFKIPVYFYLGFWVIVQFVGQLSGQKNVGWWAHIAGFFLGFLFVYIYRQISKTWEVKNSIS